MGFGCQEKLQRGRKALSWRVEGWQGPYQSKLSARGNVKCLKAKLWFEQVPAPAPSTPYPDITQLLYSLLAETKLSFS